MNRLKGSRQMDTGDWRVICDKCKKLGFDFELYKNAVFWGKLIFDLAKLENLKAQGFSVSAPDPKKYL